MKNKPIVLLLAVLTSLNVNAQTIDVNTQGELFEHLWSVGTSAGRVNEGLRASWRDQLKLVKENCGFQNLRMHGLFDDDMCIYFPQRDGSVIYNWQYVDDVYDFLLSLGIRPFVELSFFPTGIAAKDSRTQMWYRNKITPDSATFDKWHDLIKAFAQHVVDRYGLDEVKTWRFEVWNEPNLYRGFLEGTRSDYFRLYKESALALKAVSPELKVGGPATSNFIADHRHDGEIIDHKKSFFYPQDQINKQQWHGIWIEEFLDYCWREQLTVDFVSCHPYPTDYALDPVSGRSKDAIRYVNSTRDDIDWLARTVKASHYPDAELQMSEWSSSPNSRDAMHDVLPPAAYVVKVNLDCIGRAQSLYYWTFTDIFEEKGGGQEIYHGGFGMINFQGIVKPTYHAYRMLHQLGDVKLYYKEPIFVSRHSDSGKITALAYNYPDEYRDAVPSARNLNNYIEGVSSKQLDLRLTGLRLGAVFVIETLDKDHGNAYDEWIRMGKPHSPTRAETEHLRQYAQQTLKETMCADAEGTLVIRREISPWSLILISEL